MIDEKALKKDGGGFEALKPAVMALVNSYPGLNGRTILFQGLDESGGISVEPESGALVYSEKQTIIGSVFQECQFPFFVVYRSGASSEYQKLAVNEFLDDLGSWLCKEPIFVDGAQQRLSSYPELTDDRKIKRITRFNTYAIEPNENNTQDWLLPVTVHYTKEIELF